MKKLILPFMLCSVGTSMLLFLPTGMLLSDSEDGLNWSNFKFLLIIHTIPIIITWLTQRKVKGAFIMFLIFESLVISYLLLMFLSLKFEI
jgi:hypothetical protein